MVDVDYPTAVQLIAAGEARIEWATREMNADRMKPSDYALVVSATLRGTTALRREFGILVDGAWDAKKSTYDRLQSADPEDPSVRWHEYLDR